MNQGISQDVSESYEWQMCWHVMAEPYCCLPFGMQEMPDSGSLHIGETVAPLYVDQSRDELSSDKTVFEEIADGNDEMVIGEFPGII